MPFDLPTGNTSVAVVFGGMDTSSVTAPSRFRHDTAIRPRTESELADREFMSGGKYGRHGE